ncbi:MAG: inosose dehydratase [Acidobacteriaceae bacterium]|nr:inosose dehydratase [Acidobacteriaceae bacterium]
MITRRAFLKSAAAGLVASSIPAYALAPLTIGIGTFSYHALSFDDMMAQLEILLPTNGLHNQQIEMSRGEYMVMSHPSDELFRTAKAKLDKAGIKCVSYYAATLKNEQEVAQAVGFAKLLGAHNITGDATGSDLLKHIDRSVTEAGLTFSIHNHFFPGVKFPYESPEDVLRALAGLSANCGATADTGHFAACGFDPVDAVRKLAPRLNLVHLKDVKAVGHGDNVLLGSGIAKIPEVEAELHRQNFRRLVAIEYEKEGDDDVRDDMRTNVAFAWKYGFSGA